ncbi:MAG: hypothetical protein ACRDWD_12115 [Acidimicrobiia bacterium]
MTVSLSRRAFLLSSAAFGGAVATALLLRRVDGGPPGLAGFFSDPDAARRIGDAYLAGPGRGLEGQTLAATVAPAEAQPRAWLRTASHRELADHVREQAVRDFGSGRIVDVAGWQLAETEAALCAYWSLEQVPERTGA